MKHLPIRALTSDDAGQIAALWLVCTREVSEVEPIYEPAVTHGALQASLMRELDAAERFGWGAFDGEVLAGYVTCRMGHESELFVPRHFIYLIDLDVAPAHRGNRLSRRLLGEVERFANGIGIDRLELAYAAADDRARAVWERLGFRPHFVYMHRGV
jgi:GNAT superfamily N-acetyltransferase